MGALRTAIGEAQGTDWKDYQSQRHQHPLYPHIGYGDDLGPLSLQGLWVHKDEKRLYPVPRFLLHKRLPPRESQATDEPSIALSRLTIGPARCCHLGKVRLPVLRDMQRGFKSFDQAWITPEGLEALLRGELPHADQIVEPHHLFREEPRLGIARDNQRRTAMDGNLYQTRHLRPDHGLSLEAQLQLGPDTPPPTGLVRFGGEGRLAHLQPIATQNRPAVPQATEDTRGLILVLLSPARFVTEGQPDWLPVGFRAITDENENRCWTGTLAGVELIIDCAVIGKAQREGGWDMTQRKPRDVQSLVPAGSAYYARLAGETQPARLNDAMQTLHALGQIGEDKRLGRGVFACGLWNQHECAIK